MKTNKKAKLEINKKVISKLQVEQLYGGKETPNTRQATNCKFTCKIRCNTSGLRCDCD